MKKLIKNKKIICSALILLIFLFTMIWCSNNGFLINDDLPYSFFMRGEKRITNILQIIRNQISDYLTINGRIIIHSVVQFLLIFGKKLFSILNPIIIVMTFIVMKKIIEDVVLKRKLNTSFIYILIIILFLLMKDFNYLIHWVAGSVNYIWTFFLVILYTYYYLKNGLKKHKKINTFMLFFLSILHEITLVFAVLLILGDFINEWINKTRNFKYLKPYLIVLILGALIIFLSPGNSVRITNSYPLWNEMTMFEKLINTIPVVSINLFNLSNIYNIIPLIYIILLNANLIKSTIKNKETLVIINIALSVFSLVTNSGWIYLLLAITTFISMLLINFKENNKLNIILLCFYGVSFSMILTPEYNCSRPNYYLYMWMNIFITKWIYEIIEQEKNKNILKTIFLIFSALLLINEIKIYSYIGKIHTERINAIKEIKKSDNKLLELKEIKQPYAKFHPDANFPDSSNYWGYRYFLQYYNLPSDIETVIVK